MIDTSSGVLRDFHGNVSFSSGTTAWFLSLAVVAAVILVCILLAERILVALAAYHDALSLGRQDESLFWGLLIGFLGFIPAMIYLVVRSRGPVPGAEDHRPQNADQLRGKAKKELIAGIICIGIAFIAILAICAAGCMLMLNFNFQASF